MAERASLRVGILLSDGLSAQGGIGRVVSYLTRHLAAHRPDIATAVFRARYSTRAGLKHLTVPAALARFAAACRSLDVAHINIAPRGSTWRKMLFARVARLAGVPVLLHLHGSGYDEYYGTLSPTRQAAVRRFFGDADAVVVLSPFWRRFAEDTLGVPKTRITEIPNGVPEADPPVGSRPPAEEPHVLFLGVIGERKGIDVFLDALATLLLRGVPFRATVGGNGEVEAARGRAAELGLADRVAFIGWVDEARVDAELRRADLFVLPSRAENQPVAILEAMARSVPVVATRVGGIPEQLADGTAGLLVEAGDAEALAEAMAGLLRDAPRRTALGAAGRDRFTKHYALSACADRFAALYHRLADTAA